MIRRFHLGRAVACLIVILLISVPVRTSNAQGPNPAERSHSNTQILAHYMAWYEAKPFSPHWGWHWTMGVFKPEGEDSRQPAIASHYRPLIGPYDSGDPDVIEYHALLMKLAGIDGVVIDWYGTADYFDYASINRHASAFLKQAVKTGLQVVACYEDQTIPRLVEGGRLKLSDRVEHARREIDWLRKNWFAEPVYLKLDRRPVLLSFGHDGLTETEWRQVLLDSASSLLYLSEHTRRNSAAGAFDWPVPAQGAKAQDAFYREAKNWPLGIAVAFPRFHDIYEQAKVHPSWGSIDDEKGKTFSSTLETALKSGLPLVQICTWNDWGEGTMIEPSREFGFRDLEVVQRLRRQYIEPGFRSRTEDLELPVRLFKLRKESKQRAIPVLMLDEVARLLSKRAPGAARDRLDAIEREMPPKP
jgi:hypothetical protein